MQKLVYIFVKYFLLNIKYLPLNFIIPLREIGVQHCGANLPTEYQYYVTSIIVIFQSFAIPI